MATPIGNRITGQTTGFNPTASNTSSTTPSHGLTGPSASDSFQASTGLGASASGTVDGVNVSGNVNGPNLTMNGSASSHVGLDGVDVKLDANIQANLLSAGADANKTFSVTVGGQKLDITLDLKALGNVGASGDVNLTLHIGTDGSINISAGADGFAGAKASLAGTVTVADDGKTLASGTATVSAYAGVTASAGAHLTLDHGDVDFEAKASASVGTGMGFDVKGNVSALNTAEAVAKMFGGLAGEGVDWAEASAQHVVGFLGNEAGDVSTWIKDHTPHLGWPW